MSFLGGLAKKIGHVITAPAKGLVHAVTDPGKWASNIGHQATDPKTLIGLASALALPGVGGALTSGLGAIPGIGGALASGAGAVGGAVSGAAGGIGSALSKIPGAQGLGSILGMGGGQVGGAIPAEAMGEGGFSLGGMLGSAGKWLAGNGGKNILGAAQGVDSILNQKKANQYGQDALNTVTNSYNERAPLRAQGLEGLLHPQTPDLSALRGIAGNLGGVKGPQAGALQQFTPPSRPVSSALPKDTGNPYAMVS